MTPLERSPDSQPSISLKGSFGPNGALYDAWESRRHNPSYDYAIIRLAPPAAYLEYIEIDTAHFKGNEAPAASVFAHPLSAPAVGTEGWTEVLGVVELGPDARHVFRLESQERTWGSVMVRMIPDGGMVRSSLGITSRLRKAIYVIGSVQSVGSTCPSCTTQVPPAANTNCRPPLAASWGRYCLVLRCELLASSAPSLARTRARHV